MKPGSGCRFGRRKEEIIMARNNPFNIVLVHGGFVDGFGGRVASKHTSAETMRPVSVRISLNRSIQDK
jgi:hypothetical protein